jgi:hypothetical protein
MKLLMESVLTDWQYNFNKDGLGNYDIVLKDNKPTKEAKPIVLNIQEYKIANFKFIFWWRF